MPKEVFNCTLTSNLEYVILASRYNLSDYILVEFSCPKQQSIFTYRYNVHFMGIDIKLIE